MVLTSKATDVWKHLNGIFCVYKPSYLNIHRVRETILNNICRDLNAMEVRPPLNHVTFDETAAKDITIKVEPSYADNVLVVGPRYQPPDIRLSWSTALGQVTSGLMVLGVNDGVRFSYKLHHSNPIRVYHLKGILGYNTDNSYVTGKVLAKAKYDHVTGSIMDKVLATFQAAHQKQMYLQSGVNIQSQAAYELAIQGMVRPEKCDKNTPVVYSLKCIQFQPPLFTLEIYAINAREDYLLFLVKEIGLKLRTLATCGGVRCIKHGLFGIDDCLLKKHWSVDHIVHNIQRCHKIYPSDSSVTGSPVLQSKLKIVN